MTSFEVIKISTFCSLFLNCLCPSAYPSGAKSINGIISKTAHKIFFQLYIKNFICFCKYEAIVRSNTWHFGHSDPDPSSAVRK